MKKRNTGEPTYLAEHWGRTMAGLTFVNLSFLIIASAAVVAEFGWISLQMWNSQSYIVLGIYGTFGAMCLLLCIMCIAEFGLKLFKPFKPVAPSKSRPAPSGHDDEVVMQKTSQIS